MTPRDFRYLTGSCAPEYIYSNVVKKTFHVKSSFCIKLNHKC